MKRDLELTRRIMLALENDEDIFFEGEDPLLITYHMRLLNDAQYLLQGREFTISERGILVMRKGYYQLSWIGHEYLQALKDDTIWNDTKDKVAKVGSWTFDLVKQIAIELAKKKIETLGIHL